MSSPEPSTSSPASATTTKSMDAIMALCKRRGFIYQASEIYGGINGFWDYGPLGAQMKKNLRDAWWEDMIMRPCWGRSGPEGEPVQCVPVETCIIQHPKVWEASGHVAGFNDPMVDDKETKQRFRADHLYGMYLIWDRGEAPEMLARSLRAYRDDEAAELPYGPNLTCVASTSGEAFGMFRSVERKIRAKMVPFDLAGCSDPIFRYIRDDAPDTPCIGMVLQVPSWLLQRHSACVPSPFYKPEPSAFRDIPRRITNSPLTPPRQFNLMFHSYTGAVFDEDAKVYLRPETAQGVFVQFKNVVDTTRIKIPFGIGNTGRSFRNEVTPRNFTFRSREFEQAELEFFCHPDHSVEWYKFWRDFRMEWWKSIGLAGDNLILREHDKDELSHYSQGTSDVEYRFPFTAPGFGELEGIAHRGNYDLNQHQTHSKAKLEYFDTDRGELLPNGSKKGERYLPHCIEPAAGLDRGVLALICEAYTKDDSRPSPEFMKFHPRIAPIKAAVFPLVNKDGMPEIADKLHADLSRKFWRQGFVETDAKQSIGKRYARMDEAGCPFCFTIDGETAAQQTVTCRDRDSGQQQRIAIDQVATFVSDKLGL